MHRRPFFSLIAAAAAALVAFSGSNRAGAATILTFGQTSSSNTIVATNPSATSTTISGANVAVTITQFVLGGTPISAFFNLSANSVGAATTVAGIINQKYSGTFSFTSGTGGSGTNYLSGTFSDAVAGSGTGLTLTASNATGGETLTFTSSVIPAADLGNPTAISFGFSNVTPAVTGTPDTIQALTASVAGTASATAVPEPSSMAIAGLGALGLIGYGIRRRKSA